MPNAHWNNAAQAAWSAHWINEAICDTLMGKRQASLAAAYIAIRSMQKCGNSACLSNGLEERLASLPQARTFAPQLDRSAFNEIWTIGWRSFICTVLFRNTWNPQTSATVTTSRSYIHDASADFIVHYRKNEQVDIRCHSLNYVCMSFHVSITSIDRVSSCIMRAYPKYE